MKTNELLRDEPQYRLILATHAVLRNFGYSADDIFICIGKNPWVMLKTQGQEFVITIGTDLCRPSEQFHREWTYIAEHNHEISDEVMKQTEIEWRRLFNIPQLILALHAKGFTIPALERNARPDYH